MNGVINIRDWSIQAIHDFCMITGGTLHVNIQKVVIDEENL